MADYAHKTKFCCTCIQDTVWNLTQQLFLNGSENFLWVCSKCDTKNPGKEKELYIKSSLVKSKLTPEQIFELPNILPKFWSRCVRCGNRTTELHHWAPKAIFGNEEAEKWPQDYLCKDCHDQWHRLVTPQIVS